MRLIFHFVLPLLLLSAQRSLQMPVDDGPLLPGGEGVSRRQPSRIKRLSTMVGSAVYALVEKVLDQIEVVEPGLGGPSSDLPIAHNPRFVSRPEYIDHGDLVSVDPVVQKAELVELSLLIQREFPTLRFDICTRKMMANKQRQLLVVVSSSYSEWFQFTHQIQNKWPHLFPSPFEHISLYWTVKSEPRGANKVQVEEDMYNLMKN